MGRRGHVRDQPDAAGAATARTSAHPDTLGGDASLELPEFDDAPGDPLQLLREWLAQAAAAGVREPLAVTLATAGASGEVTSRTVLVKGVADDGSVVFTSHTGSRKGRDLAENPQAAMTFYWRERLQQVNLRGAVARLPAAESDRLFAERPRAAQATAAASQQSRPLHDAEGLVQRAEALADGEGPLPRPEGWSGYALTVRAVEFWHGSLDRLHRRLSYVRDGAGWDCTRLQP